MTFHGKEFVNRTEPLTYLLAMLLCITELSPAASALFALIQTPGKCSRPRGATRAIQPR